MLMLMDIDTNCRATDLSHANYDIECRSIEADERQLQMGSPVDDAHALAR